MERYRGFCVPSRFWPILNLGHHIMFSSFSTFPSSHFLFFCLPFFLSDYTFSNSLAVVLYFLSLLRYIYIFYLSSHFLVCAQRIISEIRTKMGGLFKSCFLKSRRDLVTQTHIRAHTHTHTPLRILYTPLKPTILVIPNSGTMSRPNHTVFPFSLIKHLK